LITGATGMLGRYLFAQTSSLHHEVTAPCHSDCDLNDPTAIVRLIHDIKPAAVFHLAAQTNVDLCEREPADAARVNFLATKEIARATADVGGWLAYVSTSNVFGTEGKPAYNEIDLPGPVNYYGRSKLWGEVAVVQHLPHNHLIARAGWMIGGGQNGDHKFVGRIISQIRSGALELKAVDDKQGNITVAEDLTKFLVTSMESHRTGLIHYASKGTVTRFQIASEIAQLLRFRGEVHGVKSSMFPLSAPRPTSEGIESLFFSDGDVNVPGFWRDDLRKYVSLF
jgi:dTDP-4-dehydrorhamnose reductase